MMNKENIKGKIIVFEGLDGCFKETNSKALTEYLKTYYNEKTVLISFPDYKSDSSFFASNFLRGDYGKLNEVSPYTATLFYALDRFHNKKLIRDYINDGYTVIIDRYVGSNILYQSTKFNNPIDKDNFISWCKDLEYGHNGMPKEDITLFMHIPVKLNNLKNRVSKASVDIDIYESNTEYQLKLEDRSGYICEKLNWNIVKCYDTNKGDTASISNIYNKDIIFSNILEILNSYFN